METSENDSSQHLDDQEIRELKKLLWGTSIKSEIFHRWNQGFEFSENEPIALVQQQGGPCAVIASTQAFLLKNILFSDNKSNKNWRHLEDNEKFLFLANSICDMLHQVSSNEHYCIVQFSSGEESNAEITSEEFHSRLKVIKCTSSNEATNIIQSSIAEYLCQFGVLLLMYSVLLTKGLGIIKKEMEDSSEVLIDSVHGHGSQSLINLLITGNAVTNLWDGEREVCGLKLQGIPSRSSIGFLTQLEHLRYTEVGWNLKNPVYPIWILGSETHLTVLFSLEETLVTHETQAQIARRTFGRFDTECNGFITIDKFGTLLKSLNLESAPDYVNIMKSRVDEEGLGIIMLSKFMEEFFPNEKAEKSANKFTIFHINCLARSSTRNKVEFVEGQAEICDPPDMQVLGDTSNIRTCLMTKWPTIELKWINDRIPSLN